jgi:hypothetical protein
VILQRLIPRSSHFTVHELGSLTTTAAPNCCVCDVQLLAFYWLQQYSCIKAHNPLQWLQRRRQQPQLLWELNLKRR